MRRACDAFRLKNMMQKEYVADSACSPAMIVKNGPMPMACTATELTMISTPAETNMVAWTEAMAAPAADCLMLDTYLSTS